MSQPEHSSRREFLRTSGVMTAGGVLASQLVLPSAVHAASSETIRVGLIGCGGRGTGAARDALSADPAVTIVAMGDAFADRLNGSLNNLQKIGGDRVQVSEDRKFAGFDAFQKVLAQDIDMVILATPPGFRPQHFAAAVEAGKHVFMEKPVAVDAPGVRQVLEAAKKAKEKNLGVGVGLQRRHQMGYQDTIKRLQDGVIGDIHTMRAYWNSAGVWVNPRKPDQTDMEYQMRNWYYFNWLCGDHIVEQHIHNLDVINWLKDAYPVRAQGMGGRQVRTDEKYGEIFDHHMVEFEYADGSRMFSFCRHIPNTWGSVSEHVQGTKGRSDINSYTIFPTDGKPTRYRGDNPNPYVQEHKDLIASIRSGSPYNEAEFGALSTMTSIFGRMATYSGKMLNWDECLNSNIKLGPEEFTWEANVPPPQVAVPGQTQVV